MTHAIAHTTCQTFTFLTRRWCITRAWELIEADPNAAQLVKCADITRLEEFLYLTKATPGHVKLLEIQVDPGHAATTDLSMPVLVVRTLSNAGEDLGAMVIDGWHRIYRARTEGITHLPAYVLSTATELAVRIPFGLRRR